MDDDRTQVQDLLRGKDWIDGAGGWSLDYAAMAPSEAEALRTRMVAIRLIERAIVAATQEPTS